MNEKLGLRRLMIARNDLAESKNYFEAYLAFANSPSYCEAYGQLGLDMAGRVENAFLSCGIIAYARPFTKSRGGTWKSVPGRFTSGLTKEERRIHDYVLDARKKLVAHSDFDGVDVRTIETERGDRILSVRPAPIVMISGEADSLNVSEASTRTKSLSGNTIRDIRDILQNVDALDGGRLVYVQEERRFDIDEEHCMLLVKMAEKIIEAIEGKLDAHAH